MVDFMTWHGLDSERLVEHVLAAIADIDDYYTQRRLRIDSVRELYDKIDVRQQIIDTVVWLQYPLPVDGDPAWEDFYCEVAAHIEHHYRNDY